MNHDETTCKEMLWLLFNKTVKHMLSFKQKDKIFFFLCLNVRHPSALFKGTGMFLRENKGKLFLMDTWWQLLSAGLIAAAT